MEICSSLRSVDAASFECKDEADACKLKFTIEYQKEFRELYLNITHEAMHTFTEAAKTILDKLTDEDAFRKTLEDSINNVDASLKELLQNANDENRLMMIHKEAMQHMIIRDPDVPAQKEAMHDLRKSVDIVKMRMPGEIAKLWCEMYAGLSESDLNAYPEYTTITDFFKAFEAETDMDLKGNHFTAALEVLAMKFDLRFFEAITSVGM